MQLLFDHCHLSIVHFICLFSIFAQKSQSIFPQKVFLSQAWALNLLFVVFIFFILCAAHKPPRCSGAAAAAAQPQPRSPQTQPGG